MTPHRAKEIWYASGLRYCVVEAMFMDRERIRLNEAMFYVRQYFTFNYPQPQPRPTRKRRRSR